ncbi:hypothetical protein LTR99_003718 [Exophiala xenobiotica]|uniref:Uncharacterized protein n=1 Tax=Vermiconidia calcicola TaxID=1690605 RepID=A0AAV9PZQ9_9PEZI|nr:hypothetical protein LTR92_008628 [Exophiala xenobiotica]KAK5531411.1 hypothetical protein LTR25_008520 [Vermiconidia calcicola]KAK5544802.1 hypothetical protein LTR23_004242 [Chaetothyriales sp. CCFEE 6169]KAK5222488.1 hypothetical protein LTR47_010481 [Exophiala xenobiotica]KAK5304653.1 hypothetical protein LTR99_003718 [Exophiala xenobiotica]
MAAEVDTDVARKEYWSVEGDVMVGLYLDATQITTACLERKDDDYVAVPLVSIEVNDAYKEYMRTILEHEPDTSKYVMIDGKNTDMSELYNTPARRLMFEDTLKTVAKAVAAKLDRGVKLCIMACAPNHWPTTYKIVHQALSESQIPYCQCNSAIIQPINWVSGMVGMDNARGAYDGRGLERSKDHFWYVITVAIYPGVIQILVDEGEPGESWPGSAGGKCVRGQTTDENGCWADLAGFGRAFVEAIQEHVTEDVRGPGSNISRVVITGHISPSSAEQLSHELTTVAPYLQGKIQGVAQPAFITAMGAVCYSYAFWKLGPPNICRLPVG